MKISLPDNLKQLLKKYRYAGLILLIGLILLLIPNGGRENSGEAVQVSDSEQDAFDLEEFTRSAESVLSQIQGAGKIRLLLTMDSSGLHEYLFDQDTRISDGTEETREEAVLYRQDGDELPVIRQSFYPEFRGALVICEGADSATVTLGIKQALSGLTGLGLDRITVLKMD